MRTALGILCFLLLCGLLAAGLWPFGSPRNRVAWLNVACLNVEGLNVEGPSNVNGLRFGGKGTAIGTGLLESAPLEMKAGAEWSLELWLRPAVVGSSTIFAVDAPGSAMQFSVRQSLTDVALRVEAGGRHIDYYVSDILHPAEAIFLTITSGPRGLSAFVNGAPRTTFADVHVPAASLAGRLVLANSLRQHDGWNGDLLGLAVYQQELTGGEAARHYENWTKRGRPESVPELSLKTESPSSVLLKALFLFDERGGRVVHNRADTSQPSLYIPERYTILRQWFLEPFWREFEPMKKAYWTDVFINIGGFIPFGFFMCAYWSWLTKAAMEGASRWILPVTPGVAAVLCGAAISLTIEILQSHLPTRDSSMTDVITNILGSCLGALACGSRAARIFLPLTPAAGGRYA